MIKADALKKLGPVQSFERIKNGVHLKKDYSLTKANQKPSSMWSSKDRTLFPLRL